MPSPNRSRRRASAILAGCLLSILGLAAAPYPAAVADPGAGSVPATVDQHDEIVVKIDKARGRTIGEVTSAYPVAVDSTLLGSRGIYLVKATRSADKLNDLTIAALAARLKGSSAVVYAEPNFATTLTDSRYRVWPEGLPADDQEDSSQWFGQPMVSDLELRKAHTLSQGIGVTVAVLDTGIDPDHPALSGRIRAGYDYLDDDDGPTDVKLGVDSNGNGSKDDAYGHGTFVAGMVALVAPDARIMPMRVLNSDGTGNIFLVAQAIMDAADAGADVINISFGTDQAVESDLLSEAIAAVQREGVVVVAAAGNDGTSNEHYPAADTGVLSVSALAGSGLLPSWATWGSWVDVAAPGDDLIGPVPGGAYARWSGTSMSTPLVAGQVALIRARFPSDTPAEQVAAVTSTSRAVPKVNNGAVDPYESLDRPSELDGDLGDS